MVIKMNNLELLQEKLQRNNYDAFIIPTADFHGSEYISDYFQARKYFSGFTGSAGTLLVLKHSAFLWTDGRYFIQAAMQLEDSGIELMKMGEPNVPTLTEFLNQNALTIKTNPNVPVITSGTSTTVDTNIKSARIPIAQCAPCSKYLY